VDASTFLPEAMGGRHGREGHEISKATAASSRPTCASPCDKLRTEYGLAVEPITFDPPDPKDNSGRDIS